MMKQIYCILSEDIENNYLNFLGHLWVFGIGGAERLARIKKAGELSWRKISIADERFLLDEFPHHLEKDTVKIPKDLSLVEIFRKFVTTDVLTAMEFIRAFPLVLQEWIPQLPLILWEIFWESSINFIGHLYSQYRVAKCPKWEYQ